MPAPLVDDARVAGWMDSQGIAVGAPISITRVTTGHSNEVFRVERGDLVAMLRRPPRTPLSPTAHDMAREFRVLSALCDPAGWHDTTAVPVPVPIALCTDVDVIGAPFYLMHVVDGVVVRESVPDAIAGDPDAARACGLALVDALAGIHRFDWRAGGLEGFGRPDGYLERQVPRWIGQLERYQTRPLPDVDAAGEWLAAHVPPAQPPGVIHGDYKLDNVMLAPHLPIELVAVVDWEQSTIGDPLVDLGWLLGLSAEAGEVSLSGGSPFGRDADLPTRCELLARYAEHSDRDVSNINYYCVLGLFKLACVMEGSFARFRAGTSDDAYFASLEQGVPALARRALEFASGTLIWNEDFMRITERDAATVRRFYAAFAERDFETVRACFTPDAVWHLPGRNAIAGDHRGWDAIYDNFLGRIGPLSGETLRAGLVDVAVGGEYLVAVQHPTADHDGRKLDVTGCQLIRMEAGLIAEVTGHYSDQYAFDAFWVDTQAEPA